MGDNEWVWWVLAAVVLLVIAYVVWSVRRRAAGRSEAVRLRERAAAGEPTIGEREGSARQYRTAAEQARAEADQLQAQADRARERAEDLEARAHGAMTAAREARDEQTEDLLKADDVDPDARR